MARAGGGKAGKGWRSRGMGSRTEAYQEKGTVRAKDWAADADRYRQKDSDRNKEIQIRCRTKGKKEDKRRKERCGQGGRQNRAKD